MKKLLKTIVCTGLFTFCIASPVSDLPGGAQAANPYLPVWEHIPDGEPYLFEDPETGEERVYIYGSHDTLKTSYCGKDLVAWSAPADDLNNWRYEGVIFESVIDGKPDTLFAPDVALVEDEDGNKTYYLYPNNQAGGRQSMVAKSDSPVGPFEVCNWKENSTTQTEGCMGFDPAVFVDDDGRVYGYWGFQTSCAAELDPETMASVKEGTETIKDMIPSCNAEDDNDFRFFEASSIRKISAEDPSNPSGKDRYIFIYSRKSKDGEFGLGSTNSTLAYAYGDNPLGPWTYGGTLVDARARDVDENGNVITTLPSNNTHGSLVEVDDQWWLCYHRAASGAYSRQAMAAPVEMTIEEDGTVNITEAEVTSEGFEIDGLDPYARYSASIACYVKNGPKYEITYNQEENTAPITGNKNGSIVGYKYYNFDGTISEDSVTQLALEVVPKGTAGTIKVMLDRPWEATSDKEGGTVVGEIQVPARSDGKRIELKTALPDLDDVDGKHAVYFVFESEGSGEICELYYLQFREVYDYINSGTSKDEWEILSGAPDISENNISLSDGDNVQVLNGEAWKDYIVSADISVGSGELGIQVRKEDELNYYSVNVKKGQIKLVSVVNGKEYVLGRAALPELSDISVNCVGDIISVRADDAVILSVQDDSHGAGTIGFAQSGGQAVLENVVVQNSAQADGIQRIDTIMIDGKPIDGYQSDLYEYTVMTDGSSVPTVAASSTDPSVKVVVSQPEEVPGTAIVQFIGSVRRTYYINFSVQADLENEMVDWGTSLPAGWTVADPKDAQANIKYNGNTVVITGVAGSDYPNCYNRLVRTEGLENNWTVTVKVQSDSVHEEMAMYTQLGIGVLQNGSSVGKIDIEKNWGGNTNIVTLVSGGSGEQKSIGASWNHWLRLEKLGSIIKGYYSTDGQKFEEIGSMTINGNIPAQIQLYATPQKGADFNAQFSSLTIESYKGGTSSGASDEAKADLEKVQQAAEAINSIVLIPNSEYGDIDAKKAAALEVLSDLCDDVEFTFGAEDDYLSLTITKGQAHCTIQPMRLLVQRSYEDLQDLIEKAEALKAIDYTEESYARLEKALKKAQAAGTDADEYTVARLYETLAGSMDVLEESENVDTAITVLPDRAYTNEQIIQVVITEGSGQNIEKLTVYKDGKAVKSFDRSEASQISGREYTFDIDFAQENFGDGKYTLEALVSGELFEAAVVSDRTIPEISFDEKTGSVIVTDDNLETVMLDGNDVENTFVLDDCDVHRVQAEDKAGNTTILEVQMKKDETPDTDGENQDGTSDGTDETPDGPDDASDGQNSTSGGQGGAGGSSGTSEDDPAAVRTGDYSPIGMWAAVSAAAFALMAGSVYMCRRRSRKDK